MKSALNVVLIGLLLGSTAFAQTRRHGAHQHGVAEVNLSFEAETGVLSLQVSSDAIYGFEHEAKTNAQKKAVEDGLQKLESKMGQMIQFSAELGCQWEKEKIETVRQGRNSKHSEVHAEFGITCQKSPKGTDIQFQFAEHFPKIKSAQVTVLVDTLQKSFKADKDQRTLSLK